MIDYVYVVNASGEGHLDILHGGVALYGDSGETGNHHVWWVKKTFECKHRRHRNQKRH